MLPAPQPSGDPAALIPLPIALRDLIHVSRKTARRWIDLGILPQPVRPVSGPKGKLFFRRGELLAALDQLAN
jgi:hypothetical protein